METINITEIVQAVITLLVALVSVVLVPWIRGKVGEQNMADFLKWVEIAVAAAEQLYDSTAGQTKKNYVLAYLDERGYTVEERDLDAAIEAAVLKLHNELYKGGGGNA